LLEPRYVSNEFSDRENFDVRILWCGGEFASTGNHTPNAYFSKFISKLIVTQVSSSLYLVKGVVIFTGLNEMSAPPFCFDHKHPRRG